MCFGPFARPQIGAATNRRLGQKNTRVRRRTYLGARKGTRPRQPADGRYQNAYLFGAICPARGTGAAIMMPIADTMPLHLAEISRAVVTGAHAVILMDQAAWHTTAALNIPKNLSLIFIPPKSPELNPVENIWQYLRQTWLANRIFETIGRHSRRRMPSLEQPHRKTRRHNLNRKPRLGKNGSD